MPRIFFPLEESARSIHITGEKARYLSTVLRCISGDEMEILNGKGLSYGARITSITSREVTAEILGIVHRDTESPVNLILVQGLLKGEKMEMLVQKTTELGVKEIVPAVTERSQVRSSEKIARWRKIAEDASRQSGRTAIPIIHQVTPFRDIFIPSSTPVTTFRGSRGILFWEKEGLRMNEASRKLAGCGSLIIAVGPEGGFAEGEVAIAKERGFLIANLGSRILRAETAAIAATTMAQVLIGDMG